MLEISVRQSPWTLKPGSTSPLKNVCEILKLSQAVSPCPNLLEMRQSGPRKFSQPKARRVSGRRALTGE